MTDKTYNGYPNWTRWNVSLWINNDEGLYRFALDCVRRFKSKRRAAAYMLENLPKKTPDGATYSIIAIMCAMADLE